MIFYRKTAHTWAIDNDPDIPLGPPQLMISATGDGQLSEQVVQEHDNMLGISNQWEKSETGIAFELKEVKLQACTIGWSGTCF